MKTDRTPKPKKKPANKRRSAGCTPMPGSRAMERAWIVEQKNGSLVFDAEDGSAWPYIKLTPKIITALTKEGISQ